ncbi:hypothetical protein CUMW_274430 [Citrus unshiu]|uniref:F-box domain-containing protein n=1 Tax=Citrus unshiu TaxID=55188 RepID=A0A2H5MYB1_CITUN|nr:hypothetical protein CUMW_274430 [Citrus unshiu]
MEANFDTNCYFNVLPEECVATVFSLTCPLDACRSSLVSSSFRSAMDSDIIWDKFLPSDWPEIVSKSVSPLAFSSKKELFALLCHPFLIDAGKISFKLEKSSGKKSYILSARALSITWSSNPIYWSWVSMQESRFSEVAVLRTSNWLEIEGKIKTKMLSQNTMYGAYLIMKISDRAYGLDSEAAEISIEIGGRQASKGKAYLGSKQKSDSSVLVDGMEMMVTSKLIDKGGENEQIPCEKEDGWVEIELGKFFNGVRDDDEVKMSLKEVKGYQLKGGIIVEGMEVRPKH